MVNIKKFSSLPRGAKNLMIYYSLTSPSLVGFVIFNAYLFKLGYSVVEVGAIISVSSFLTALLIPPLGYLSDRHLNAKYFVMVAEALWGVSYFIYGVAWSPAIILIGRILFSTAILFTFAYSVYEKEIYPSDALEDVYVWHWLLPSITALLTYLGAFLYFLMVPQLQGMRFYYLAMAAISPVYILFVYLALPDLPVYRERKKLKISSTLLPLILVGILAQMSVFMMSGIVSDNLIINHFGEGVIIIVLVSALGSFIEFLSSFTKSMLPRRIWKNLPYIAMLSLGIGAAAVYISSIFLQRDSLFPIFIVFYILSYFLWPLWHMGYRPLLLPAVPQEYRGTIFSTISTIWRFTTIPLSILTALLISYCGDFSPLIFSSLFALSTVLVLIYILRER